MKSLRTTIAIVFCLLLVLPVTVNAATRELMSTLSGRILLQVESYGRAWYVDPVSAARYYLKDGEAAYTIMRQLGLGISNKDLATIPAADEVPRPSAMATRLQGRILLQVESRGEAWYVNPLDGRRYYLADGKSAYDLLRTFALGITNADLRTIPVTATQLVHDPTFDDVAYIKLRNGHTVAAKNESIVLPPASMTKLMTALVLLDAAPVRWDERIMVTNEHLAYPASLVGEDATSEIELRGGDVLTRHDLWVAMLVASSNQATIALVDASGLSRPAFIEAMNMKAAAMSLARTRFVDPTGLDAHTITTAFEMAKIAEAAFARPAIATISKETSYSINTKNQPSRTITVTDRNYSLKSFGADAAKTGYLIEAQRCVALQRGNDIIVIMHARSMTERNAILTQLTSAP